MLEQRAADIIMIDPTWAGGITESKKIATMAETYKRPVAMHDCTGPFTLYAGVHLAINATNAVYQESLRSYLRVTYPGDGHRSAGGRAWPHPRPDRAGPRHDVAARGSLAARRLDHGNDRVIAR